MNEHRRGLRKTLRVDFSAQDAQGAGELLFETLDLSVGGAFLHSELLLEQDETFSVEFRVPGVNRLMRAQARVAWVRRFPEPGQEPGMGVQFLDMSEGDQRVLEAYLKVLP
jgi:uncharacterized protein (TIGR02266 family)